jgi:hypothetical protein
VQVRLADVRVAGVLEQPDGLGRARRDVLGEQDRPVGGHEALRVEEVLDREPWAGRGRVGTREEDAVELIRLADATS